MGVVRLKVFLLAHLCVIHLGECLGAELVELLTIVFIWLLYCSVILCVVLVRLEIAAENGWVLYLVLHHVDGDLVHRLMVDDHVGLPWQRPARSCFVGARGSWQSPLLHILVPRIFDVLTRGIGQLLSDRPIGLALVMVLLGGVLRL